MWPITIPWPTTVPLTPCQTFRTIQTPRTHRQWTAIKLSRIQQLFITPKSWFPPRPQHPDCASGRPRWHKSMTKWKVTILVIFDFSKAFDTISHHILKKKLRLLNDGNLAIQWFYSYLANRLQAVIDEGGTVLHWLRAAFGIPQSSILGPLLFAVFINDLPAVLHYSNYMLYAGDFQLYYHCSPYVIIQGISTIQQDINSVVNWTITSWVLLSIRKTQIIILGSLQSTKQYRQIPWHTHVSISLLEWAGWNYH